MQSVGIERTLRTLLRSKSSTASGLLLIAARSACAPLRLGAVRVIAKRDERASHEGLVDAYAELQEDARDALQEMPHDSPMRTDLSHQILHRRTMESLLAAQVAHDCKATEHLPAVVSIATSLQPESGVPFAEIALGLARQLVEQVRASDSGQVVRPDPAFARRAAVNALGEAIATFGNHHQQPLVDALLLLAPYDDPALKRVLHHPEHPAHEAICETLRSQTAEGVIATLAELLADTSAPKTLLKLASSRREPEVIEGLLDRLGPSIGSRVITNAERLNHFSWAKPEFEETLLALSGARLSTALELIAAAPIKRVRLVEILGKALRHGDAIARVSAVTITATLESEYASELLTRAIEDADPRVVSEAAKYLRLKKAPHADELLIGLLDHADEGVRMVVKHQLRGLNFSAYRERFPQMSERQRRLAGKLVAKADENLVETLTQELAAGAAARRLRALEYVEAMGVVKSLAAPLMTRLADNDAGVRAETVRLLGSQSPTGPVIAAISVLLEDPSSAVKAQVQKTLREIGPANVSVELVTELQQEFTT